MDDVKTIVLDNGIEYIILVNAEVDGNFYTLFSNINDEKDIKIRKLINDNGENFYIGIGDDEELKKVIMAFDKKMNS